MEEQIRYLLIGLEDGWIQPSSQAIKLYKALYEYFGEEYIKAFLKNPQKVLLP